MKVPGRAPVTATLLAGVAAVVLLPGGAGASASPGATISQDPEYDLPLPPQYLNPFPVVRLAGRTTKTGARITLLTVRSPRGSTVTLRCRGGRRRGCPYKSKTRTSPASKLLRFRDMQRRLKAGVRLRLFVRLGDTIGKYTAFTIRKNKLPRRSDACLFPGDPFEPRECP